jgi:FecR protein
MHTSSPHGEVVVASLSHTANLPRAHSFWFAVFATVLAMLWHINGHGQSLASATASGRAIAMSGEVRIQRAGANEPVELKSGDEVRNGDLIITGGQGRLQLRMVDGALFSLQPSTQFRIEKYTFENQEQSAFVTLLKGALRTASGAIGKRDPNDYRLKTPTATVGIRGTQYTAEETVCEPVCPAGKVAGLLVSVTEGRIVVQNLAGTIDVPAGQNASVAAPVNGQDQAPRLSNFGPTLSAAPLSNSPPMANRRTDQEANKDKDRDTTRETNTDTPINTAAPVSVANTPDVNIDQVTPLAVASQATSTAIQTRSSGATPIDSVPVDKRIVQTKDVVAGIQNSDYAPPEEVQQFLRDSAKIVDTAFSQQLGNGSPTQPPRPTASSDSLLTAPNQARTAQGDLTVLAVAAATNKTTIATNSSSGSTTSSNPTGGSTTGGSTTGGSTTGGSTTGGSTTGGSTTGGSTTGGSTTGGSTTTTPATNWAISLANVPVIATLQLNSSSSKITTTNGRLEAIGLCPTGLCLSRGSAQHADAASNLDASWGRWAGGTLDLDLFGLKLGIRQNGHDSVHYLVGIPATALPTTGTFFYYQSGSTAATIDNGSNNTGSFKGALGVSFGPGSAPKVGVLGEVTISGANYQFTTPGGAAAPSNSTLTLNSDARFTGTLSVSATSVSGQSAAHAGPVQCGSAGCTVNLNGGLFGPGGNTAGYSYRINGDGSITINGIGVFTKR